jgi:glucoamylase
LGFFGKEQLYMPREIVLGNGSLNVALDKKMQIRDFFYPLVGLENHAGHFFRFGIAVDGKFSWVGDDWEVPCSICLRP